LNSLPTSDPESPLASKDSVRKAVITELNLLSQEFQVLRSQEILPRLLSHSLWNQVTGILSYWPWKTEISPLPLITKAMQVGKTIGLARIQTNNPKLLEFRYWNGLTSSLITHAFGMEEPNPIFCPVIPEFQLINQENCWICLVPGLGFDTSGNRIGRGAGYYDRWIKWARKEIRNRSRSLGQNNRESIMFLGLGYEFQVLPLVPHDDLDEPLDGLLTPDKLLFF